MRLQIPCAETLHRNLNFAFTPSQQAVGPDVWCESESLGGSAPAASPPS